MHDQFEQDNARSPESYFVIVRLDDRRFCIQLTDQAWQCATKELYTEYGRRHKATDSCWPLAGTD